MIIGQRFELTSATRAVETVAGECVLLTVPAGAVVEVVCGPIDGDKAVQVDWNGRTVAMFAADLDRSATVLHPVV
jgi:hypothetical protein